MEEELDLQCLAMEALDLVAKECLAQSQGLSLFLMSFGLIPKP